MKFRLTENEFHELINDSIKKVLRETVDFNDGGEPDNDMLIDNGVDIVAELTDVLKSNDILLEKRGVRDYFIRCKGRFDFDVYFIDDEAIELKIYQHEKNTEKVLTLGFDDVVSFILKNKKMFYSLDMSVREAEREYRDELQDRKNNSMERGNW